MPTFTRSHLRLVHNMLCVHCVVLKTDWSNAMQLTQNRIRSYLAYFMSDGFKRNVSSSKYNALTQCKETQGLESYCEPGFTIQ